MAKTSNINKLTNFLALALAHTIGNIVNPHEAYSEKYKKEGDAYFVRAKKVSFAENWNDYDKTKIKEELKKKLNKELERKDFLDIKKFEIMDREIEKALKSLNLT